MVEDCKYYKNSSLNSLFTTHCFTSALGVVGHTSFNFIAFRPNLSFSFVIYGNSDFASYFSYSLVKMELINAITNFSDLNY